MQMFRIMQVAHRALASPGTGATFVSLRFSKVTDVSVEPQAASSSLCKSNMVVSRPQALSFAPTLTHPLFGGPHLRVHRYLFDRSIGRHGFRA
ncbi:hypothetical protein [Cupriavidus necator]